MTNERAATGPGFLWFLSDCWVLIIRSLKHIVKNIDQLLSLVMQPVMFMLLFRYVFGGAINTGEISYVNYLMAGIIVQTAAFGATTTAMNVALDLKRGIVDRFRSLPMADSTVLIGHVTADLVRNLISTFIMILVGLLVGFRPNATVEEWLMAAGLLMAFTMAISWLSAILGLVVKTVEAVMWVSFVAIFPLTFASSAFVPTEGMPGPLRWFAENQPVSHTIEALRALTVGTELGNHGWIALIWCAAITAVCIPLCGWMFRRYSA
jgi:ABC-2 type transport system permease protein